MRHRPCQALSCLCVELGKSRGVCLGKRALAEPSVTKDLDLCEHGNSDSDDVREHEEDSRGITGGWLWRVAGGDCMYSA